MDTKRIRRMAKSALSLFLAMVFMGAIPTALAGNPPALTGDTMLYFNPEGGIYYHTTHECHMVHPSCHSILEGFSASALDTDIRYQQLIPCPKCFPDTQADAQLVVQSVVLPALSCCADKLPDGEGGAPVPVDDACACSCVALDVLDVERSGDDCQACADENSAGCCACMMEAVIPAHDEDNCEACTSEALLAEANENAAVFAFPEGLEHTEADCLACAAEEALAALEDSQMLAAEEYQDHDEADCLACVADEEAIDGDIGYSDALASVEHQNCNEADCLACEAESPGEFRFYTQSDAVPVPEMVSQQPELQLSAYAAYSAYPSIATTTLSDPNMPVASFYGMYPSGATEVMSGVTTPAAYGYAAYPNQTIAMVGGSAAPAMYGYNGYASYPNQTIAVAGGWAVPTVYSYNAYAYAPSIVAGGQAMPMVYSQIPYLNNPPILQNSAPICWTQPTAPVVYPYDGYQNGAVTLWAQPTTPATVSSYSAYTAPTGQIAWTQATSPESFWFGEAEYRDAMAFLNGLWGEGYPADNYTVLGWKITSDKTVLSITAQDSSTRVFETQLKHGEYGWEILGITDIGFGHGGVGGE